MAEQAKQAMPFAIGITQQFDPSRAPQMDREKGTDSSIATLIDVVVRCDARSDARGGGGHGVAGAGPRGQSRRLAFVSRSLILFRACFTRTRREENG